MATPTTSDVSLIEEELECTVCYDVAASPINACGTGHLICGICVGSITTCGMCQSPLIGPSSMAERLVRKYDMKIPCRNALAGCPFELKSWLLKSHLDNSCDYRITFPNLLSIPQLLTTQNYGIICPIVCLETLGHDCNGKVCLWNELVGHLTQDHGVKSIPLDEDGSCVVMERRSALITIQNGRDPCMIVTWNGKTFVCLKVYNDGHLHFWVTVHGTESDAKGFIYKLERFEPDPKTNGMKVSHTWSLPVLPFRHFQTYSDIVKTGDFGSVHTSALNKLVKEETDGKYSWTYRLTIFEPEDLKVKASAGGAGNVPTNSGTGCTVM